MKLVLVEPYISSYVGHYYNILARLEAACKASGDEVRVLVPTDFTPENDWLRALPALHEERGIKGFYVKIRYLMKLKKILEDLAGDCDLCILTTVQSWSLIAGCLRIRVPLCLYVHVLSFRKSGRLGLLLKAARCRRGRTGLCILTPFRPPEEFRRLAGFIGLNLIEEAPVPVGIRADISEKGICATFCLTYLGGARTEKGFRDIVELIRQTEDEEFDFTVQTSSADAKPDVKLALADLESCTGRKNLTIVDRALTPAEFEHYLKSASVVWCAYEPARYRHRISGNLLESFACGKPVIVRDGTWMAEQVRRYGGGVIVGSPDPASLKSALERIKSDYEKYSHEAAEAGRALSEYNNEYKLADLLRSLAAESPRAAKRKAGHDRGNVEDRHPNF